MRAARAASMHMPAGSIRLLSRVAEHQLAPDEHAHDAAPRARASRPQTRRSALRRLPRRGARPPCAWVWRRRHCRAARWRRERQSAPQPPGHLSCRRTPPGRRAAGCCWSIRAAGAGVVRGAGSSATALGGGSRRSQPRPPPPWPPCPRGEEGAPRPAWCTLRTGRRAARLHHAQRPSGSDLRLCVARKSGHGTAPHLQRNPAATGERLRQQGTGASLRLRLRRPDDLRTARTVNLRESYKVDKTLMGDDFGGRAAMHFTYISCTFGHFSCEIGVRFCGTKTSMTVTRLV